MLINSDANNLILGTKEDGSPLTAFVIDDSIAMVRIIALTLEGFGINVIGSANNGEEATQILNEFTNPIDLVTLDIMMPIQNGLSILPSTRKAHPESKIIMISALGDKHRVLESIQMGADYYIIKPFNRGSIFTALQRIFLAKSPENKPAS
jgi:two-component system chemotaxis response regulator CheY